MKNAQEQVRFAAVPQKDLEIGSESELGWNFQVRISSAPRSLSYTPIPGNYSSPSLEEDGR